MARLTWSPSSLPSLHGRTYLVTGGNTGIGYWTVYHLARHGATVYMTSRSPEKGTQAIASIKSSLSAVDSAVDSPVDSAVDSPVDSAVDHDHDPDTNPKIHLIVMDLMSLSSVVAGARHILKQCTSLHGIVNSAGIMATPLAMSQDGYESQFQTNYLSHWLLTYHLLPLLESTATAMARSSSSSSPSASATAVRIVNVSSTGHTATLKEGITFADTSLSHKHTFRRYAQSKLANILHSKSLALQYYSQPSASASDPEQHKPGAGIGILSISLHPGNVDTQLNASAWGGSSMTPILRCLGVYITPEQGSYNSLWAVASPDVTADMSGQYFMPVGVPKPPSKLANNATLAKKLWDWTVEEMKGKGFIES
jgi:NAD(P)-dependent dehydrogenase (short-subunit alcohol dehydrogenase family)